MYDCERINVHLSCGNKPCRRVRPAPTLGRFTLISKPYYIDQNRLRFISVIQLRACMPIFMKKYKKLNVLGNAPKKLQTKSCPGNGSKKRPKSYCAISW